MYSPFYYDDETTVLIETLINNDERVYISSYHIAQISAWASVETKIFIKSSIVIQMEHSNF
jgi:predicted nucleic-acid-binding protein